MKFTMTELASAADRVTMQQVHDILLGENILNPTDSDIERAMQQAAFDNIANGNYVKDTA